MVFIVSLRKSASVKYLGTEFQIAGSVVSFVGFTSRPKGTTVVDRIFGDLSCGFRVLTLLAYSLFNRHISILLTMHHRSFFPSTSLCLVFPLRMSHYFIKLAYRLDIHHNKFVTTILAALSHVK